MYTYLRIEELVQEGRELQWVGTPFEGRELPMETRDIYHSWIARVLQLLSRRPELIGDWQQIPTTGRELKLRADEVLSVLQGLKGVSTEDYGLITTGEPGSRKATQDRR